MEQTIADLTAIPHADKLITEIVRLRRLVKRIGKKLDQQRDPNHAESREEFCESEGISLRLFYKLKKDGKGPREMELGPQCHRISPEAKAEWRRDREREAQTAKEGKPGP
jgi:hypothetical protein